MCHRINLPEEFQVLQLGMSRKVKIIFSVPCNSLRMRMTALGPGLAQGLVEPEDVQWGASLLSWGCGRREHRGWDQEYQKQRVWLTTRDYPSQHPERKLFFFLSFLSKKGGRRINGRAVCLYCGSAQFIHLWFKGFESAKTLIPEYICFHDGIQGQKSFMASWFSRTQFFHL